MEGIFDSWKIEWEPPCSAARRGAESLTDIGQIFLERARTILAEVELAEGLLDQARAVPRGTLRLTAPVSFGPVLAPALVEYASLYPQVSIDLLLSNSVVDLVGEGFDIALRVGRMAVSGLIARPLAPYRFVLCAAPSYLEKFGAPEKPEDLQHHGCLTFVDWMDGNTWTFKRGDSAERKVCVQSHMRMNDRAALRTAAIAGGGIILQSLPSIATAIDDGELIALLPDWEPPSRPLHLVWLPDRRPRQKLRTFIDFAVTRFGQNES